MCSEISSPRISFSFNLIGDGSLPIDQHVEYRRRDVTLLDSNVEFEFNISVENESSSCADELFSNGIILPIKIEPQKQSSFSHPSLPPLPPSTEKMKQITLMNSTTSSSSSSCSDHDRLEQRVSSESKSFWGFKRSSSLSNFESKRTILCPIPLLSRSNSTGSVSNSKSKKCRDSQKQISQKQNSSSTSSSRRKSSLPLSLASPSSLNQYPTILKTQFCKNPGGVYGNYHYIGPVLNVPPKLFGFGSLLGCGKEKKSKK